MTCIIGIEHAGKVYMGGDSSASNDWTMRKIAHPKVFIKDEYIVGYTTSFRMGQILEYVVHYPVRVPLARTALDFLVSQFIPQLREFLQKEGFSKIENNQEEGGQILIGYLGHLYMIESDFSVIRCKDPTINAIGCGHPFALGAAMALLESLPPHEAIIKALEITGSLSNGVCPPYYVYSV